MNLEISSPHQENNNYIFPILMNAEKVTYTPKTSYIIHKNEGVYDLSIKNKIDLQYFDTFRTNVIKKIYENQNNWFEDNFSLNDLESMFYEYLKPNFRENCIDLKCSFSENISSKYDSYIDISNDISFMNILPKFCIDCIKFDGKKFFINVICKDFERVQPKNVSSVAVTEKNKENTLNDTENPFSSEKVFEVIKKLSSGDT